MIFITNHRLLFKFQLKYVDFNIYEVLHQFLKWNPEFLKPYPVLAKFVESFEALPELTDYIKSTNHVPCYSPQATIKF